MLSLRLATLFVIAFLLVSVAQAGRGKGRGKDRKDDFEELKKEIEELNTRVEELEAGDHGAGGHVHGPKVHFVFHKDGDDDTEEREGDVVHVHVDLNHDDHSHDKKSHSHDVDDDHVHEAHCQFHGADENIDGFVHITQQGDDSSIHAMFAYLATDPGDYEMHVHVNGDLSNGCDSLGPHFMASDVNGDFGSVQPEADGTAHAVFNETGLKLTGHHGIIGRSIKIHGLDGNALACCVIGWSAEMDYAEHHGQHMGKMAKMAHMNHGGHAGHMGHPGHHGHKMSEN